MFAVMLAIIKYSRSDVMSIVLVGLTLSEGKPLLWYTCIGSPKVLLLASKDCAQTQEKESRLEM